MSGTSAHLPQFPAVSPLAGVTVGDALAADADSEYLVKYAAYTDVRMSIQTATAEIDEPVSGRVDAAQPARAERGFFKNPEFAASVLSVVAGVSSVIMLGVAAYANLVLK